MTLLADVESRPEVGSSSNNNEGSTRISYPILVLLRSPPDIPPINPPPTRVFRHLFFISNNKNNELVMETLTRMKFASILYIYTRIIN